MKRLVIAIDGPAAVGKGAAAHAVAQALGFEHVDSGAMYRALAWKVMHDSLSLQYEAKIAVLAEQVEFCFEQSRVLVDGVDVTREIRAPEVEAVAVHIAALPQVREVLAARQRALALGGGVVMEGRDIGSVVLPDADVKIFLTASLAARAKRRVSDSTRAVSKPDTLAEVAAALQARDQHDAARVASPLVVPHDAVQIDTSDMQIQDVVQAILTIIRNHAARCTDPSE